MEKKAKMRTSKTFWNILLAVLRSEGKKFFKIYIYTDCKGRGKTVYKTSKHVEKKWKNQHSLSL